MPIRFKCPHCQRVLNVKDHLAGQKRACVACKKPLVIPVPKKKAAPKGPTQAELEAMAAAALADPQEAQPQPKEQKKIKMECIYCDAQLEFDWDMGGKRTQCPECKNLIDVDKPAEEKPKDWKEMAKKGPSILLKDQPEGMEGEWGTQTAKTRVGRSTLEEVGALPEVEEEPAGIGVWVQRGFVALLVVASLAGIYYGARNYQWETRQKASIREAVQAYDEAKGKVKDPWWHAEYNRALGDYYLRAGKREEARDHFRIAVLAYRPRPGQRPDAAPAEELLLIDIALSQIELGGGEEEVIHETRYAWPEVQTALKRTLEEIPSAYGQMMALRRVNARLLEKGQSGIALGLTNNLVQGGAQGGPLTAEQIALLLQLRKDDEAEKLAKPPTVKDRRLDYVARLGYVQGWAELGDYEQAHKIAGHGEQLPHMLDAHLAVAEVAAADGKTEEARTALKAAYELLEGRLKREAVPPLTLYHAVELSARVGMTEDVDPLLKRIRDKGVLARAQLALALAGSAGAGVDPARIDAKDSLAYAQALELDARAKTRAGNRSAVLESMEDLEQRFKPLIYLGIALGVQDQGG